MHLDYKGKRKFISLITGIIILSLMVVAVIVPKVEIELTFKEKILKKIYTAKLEPTIKQSLPSLSLIPAYLEPITLDNSVETYTFKNEDIQQFLAEKIQSDVEQDEVVNLNTLQFNVEMTNPAEQIIKIYAEAFIIPKINEDQIKDEICGRSKSVALAYLKNLPQIKKVDLTTVPPYLFYIPVIKNRIKITQNATLLDSSLSHKSH